MKNAIFVAGGAGYIGSHVILELLNNEFEIVVADNILNCHSGDSSSNSPIPESLWRVEKLTNKKLKFYEVDLLHKDKIEEIFQKHEFSCVIHFVSLIFISESCKIPLEYYKNNVKTILNVLEIMNKYRVKNIIFSSSSTVYGIPKSLPITEEHPLGNCTSPYARTIYFIEEILEDLCKSNHEWKAISLRIFNPGGAHESGEIGQDCTVGRPNNLLPYVAEEALGIREGLEIFGNNYNTVDGTGVRDYVHVMDLADGFVSSLKRIFDIQMTGFEAYNLGTGNGYSVLEIIHTFEQVSGVKIPFTIVGRRAGDIDCSYADCTLAKKILHWKPKRTLVQMCKDTWEWRRKNTRGYKQHL